MMSHYCTMNCFCRSLLQSISESPAEYALKNTDFSITTSCSADAIVINGPPSGAITTTLSGSGITFGPGLSSGTISISEPCGIFIGDYDPTDYEVIIGDYNPDDITGRHRDEVQPLILPTVPPPDFQVPNISDFNHNLLDQISVLSKENVDLKEENEKLKKENERLLGLMRRAQMILDNT